MFKTRRVGYARSLSSGRALRGPGGANPPYGLHPSFKVTSPAHFHDDDSDDAEAQAGQPENDKQSPWKRKVVNAVEHRDSTAAGQIADIKVQQENGQHDVRGRDESDVFEAGTKIEHTKDRDHAEHDRNWNVQTIAKSRKRNLPRNGLDSMQEGARRITFCQRRTGSDRKEREQVCNKKSDPGFEEAVSFRLCCLHR